MDMICFTSYGKDIDMFFFTDPCYNDFQSFYDFCCKNLSSVFCYPDKMSCEIIGGMRGVMIVKWILWRNSYRCIGKIFRIF